MNAVERPAEIRPSLLPAVVGIGLAGGLILVLGFWVSGRGPAANRQPSVTILSPAVDTTISNPLALGFETSQPLELLPTGWGTGRYHLHALVNGVERMPAAADIQLLPGGGYHWTLYGLPDSAEVQLVWALPSHQRLREGTSATLLVRTDRR